jgi:hypothetical protein
MKQKFIKEYWNVVRLSEESLLVICPNPKCSKEIKESILLTNRSVTPQKKYEACPNCFTELKQKPAKPNELPKSTKIEEEIVDSKKEIKKSPKPNLDQTKDSRHDIFEKVRSLIPTNGETKKQNEKESENRITVKKGEKGSPSCPEQFGYLANRPKDVPIPQECLSCPKMVDCMLSPRED